MGSPFSSSQERSQGYPTCSGLPLEKIFVQAMQEFLEKYHGKSKGVSSYLHSFWSSAIVSVLLKWIKDGMKVPAEKIADLRLPFFKK